MGVIFIIYIMHLFYTHFTLKKNNTNFQTDIEKEIKMNSKDNDTPGRHEPENV